MSFDVDQFYHQARFGEDADREGLLRYISSFKNVVLWGAGNLGTALGQILLEQGVEISEYWDMNAAKLKICNGISVKIPFSSHYDMETTLVIPCIVNGSLGDLWAVNKVRQSGYQNYLQGMTLFEGLGCPLNHDNFDIRVCTGSKACSLCNCVRYTNLIQKQAETDSKALNYQLLTFIISTRCTLRCKYCGQRLTEYPVEKRKDFAKDKVIRDIDHVMNAVDFVGMISVIGGEPFLHPDLNEIVDHLLKWKNFGVVNITTNGIFHVSEEIICRLKDRRVKISFSAYDSFLTQQQQRLLNHNIELVQNAGINYSIAHPLWCKPSELEPHQHSERHMTEKKKLCESTKMCAAVRDGKFIACSVVENIDGLGLYDIGDDLVDVTTQEGLRERLIQNRAKPFYHACRYCGDAGMEEIPAGEQIISTARN